MNMQKLYKSLAGRAVAGNIINLIVTVLLGIIMLGICIGFSFFWKAGFSSLAGDSSDVISFFAAVFGNFFSGMVMFLAIIALVMMLIPMMLYLISTIVGFASSEKERKAITTPGANTNFHHFKVDAIWKLIVNLSTLAFIFWTDISGWARDIRRAYRYKEVAFTKIMAEHSVSTLKILVASSPLIVVTVLAILTLVDIGRWRDFVKAAREKHTQETLGDV